MNRELKLWTLFAPFLAAQGAFQALTATNFDANEIEGIGWSGVILRAGAWMLTKKPIRDFGRAMLDSMEKNERDGTP